MTLSPEDVEEVVEALKHAKDRMRELRDERDRLLEANRKLIDLVELIEDELDELEAADEEGFGGFDHEGYQYSYGRGWMPRDVVHKESLNLGEELDVAEIDSQLQTIRDTIERIRTYKNQDED